jgi:hypothetical protein
MFLPGTDHVQEFKIGAEMSCDSVVSISISSPRSASSGTILAPQVWKAEVA